MALKKYDISSRYKSFEIVQNDRGWHVLNKGVDRMQKERDLAEFEFHLREKEGMGIRLSSDEERILKVVQEEINVCT